VQGDFRISPETVGALGYQPGSIFSRQGPATLTGSTTTVPTPRAPASCGIFMSVLDPGHLGTLGVDPRIERQLHDQFEPGHGLLAGGLDDHHAIAPDRSPGRDLPGEGRPRRRSYSLLTVGYSLLTVGQNIDASTAWDNFKRRLAGHAGIGCDRRDLSLIDRN
jgi:hypothetical protein